jgi:hypothetical protein
MNTPTVAFCSDVLNHTPLTIFIHATCNETKKNRVAVMSSVGRAYKNIHHARSVLRWAVLYAAQSECMTVIVQIEGLHLA